MTHLNQKCAFQKGVVLPQKPWTIMSIELFYRSVAKMRELFLEHAENPSNFQGEIVIGSRVMSDEHVLMRIKANIDEAGFRLNPHTCCYEALHACAEADWYYQEHGVEQSA